MAKHWRRRCRLPCRSGDWACCACWMTRRLAGAVLAELEVLTSASRSSEYSPQWRMTTFGRSVADPSFLAAGRLPLCGRKIVIELGKFATLNMLANQLAHRHILKLASPPFSPQGQPVPPYCGGKFPAAQPPRWQFGKFLRGSSVLTKKLA